MTFLDQCVCCGGKSYTPLYRSLISCRDCGHTWFPQIPETPDLERIYEESYFHGEEYLDYGMERNGLERNFRQRLKVLLELHPAGGKLFEVGCSYGYFLNLAAKHFDVSGCDISEHAVERALGLLGPVVTRGDYLQLATQRQAVDVVCLWDTLEHLPQPDLVVAHAARHLKCGGTLALSTGDMGSFCARVRGSTWRLIHPPSHLHYFTRHSLSRLLIRCGFRIRLVRRPWFWRSAQAVAYRLLCTKHRNMMKSLYFVLQKHGCLNFCFPFNLGDLMEIYACKP